MGDRVLSTELWKVAAEALSRMQERLLLLGRKSAHERVAAFLLEMAERTGGTDTIALPMSRLDIADYLGLTIETVSRTISQLEHTGVIDLPRSRQIELRDRRALRLLDG